LGKNQNPKPAMKRTMLPSVSNGKAAVIGMTAVALLLVGCSKRDDSSKPDQRASTAPAGKTNQTIPDWAVEGSDTNTASTSKTNLTPQQLAELKTKAEMGDAESQYKLALLYVRGEGVPKNDSESLNWLNRAAENGHAEAAYSLAIRYHYGGKHETNATLALRWLKAAAERGQSSSQSSLADSYRWDSSVPGKSWGTGKDLAEAAKWYRKAAEQGDASSQTDLGEMYLRGEGVPTNTSEGLRLVKQAIATWEKEANEAPTATNLAHLSPAERQSLVEHTMSLVVLESSMLGEYYYKGSFLPKDLTNAIYWYEKAASAPDDDYASSRAQFQLGYIHATETKNSAEAAKWFRKRAGAGDATAQYNLAMLLLGNRDVPQDWGEAISWFRKAAEAGNVQAQVNLALMYREGQKVPRDYVEAVKWLHRAAEQGDTRAQNDLGVRYANGEGVPRDYIEAYKWYNVAAASGEDADQRETSRKNLNGITRYMTRDQIAEAQRRSSAFVARKESEATTKRRDIFDTIEEFERERPRATGTAFFITDDGYLLTSAHVVSPPEPKTADGFLDARAVTRIEVTVAGKTHFAKLLKADNANDVAVLKVEGKFIRQPPPGFVLDAPAQSQDRSLAITFKALPLSPSRAVKLGDTIRTLGFPNTDIQGTEPKFTAGEINSLAGVQDDPRHFQISVPVQPGNSGGPLLDSSGNVIGIVSARLWDIATLKITGSLPQNVNYALKSSFITAFLETLPDVSPNLKPPRQVKARSLAEIADEAKPSVVLVTVY
jgi:TPR repeat protein